MYRRAGARAGAVLDEVLDAFRRAGRTEAARRGRLEALLTGDPPVRVRMAPVGRVFGGTYGLEIATDEPVLPPSRGLSARGRGMVRWQGIAFRARPGDPAGRGLAARLAEDESLAEALSAVHFERIRVEPDGRPVIRHMGGSLVWMLFPPMTRPIPFVDEQAHASLAALQAFARAGSRTR